MVAVSDFGMMSETLNFGVPPLMDFASHTFAYDQRVSLPVITFMGLASFVEFDI